MSMFLAGINHIYYHGDAYSPADAPWPGWLFYASTQFNTRNPLWRDISGDGLNAYIARAQSLLQSGTPDNDLLVFWPTPMTSGTIPQGQQIQLTRSQPNGSKPRPDGKLMMELIGERLCLRSHLSDAQLALTHSSEDGSVQDAGRHLSLDPRAENGTHGRLKRCKKRHGQLIAKEGATVAFVDALPADVPGFGHLGRAS